MVTIVQETSGILPLTGLGSVAGNDQATKHVLPWNGYNGTRNEYLSLDLVLKANRWHLLMNFLLSINYLKNLKRQNVISGGWYESVSLVSLLLV